jgi:uncharacterized RDD family membrane protein YckC
MEKIRHAAWRSRFSAWLIDLLLMSILWNLVAIALNISPFGTVGLGCQAAMMFLYWTALEGYRGQSIGKMVFNLSVVGLMGERIGFKDAAVESFGKAFLLPLDCLLGWLALPGRGQRIFNRLSDTVVAETGDEGQVYPFGKSPQAAGLRSVDSSPGR